jgi:hypothetical protein
MVEGICHFDAILDLHGFRCVVGIIFIIESHWP